MVKKPRKPVSPELAAARRRIWAHNSLRGHCALGVRNMVTVAEASTTTAEAKDLAIKIRADLQRLAKLLEERID